jgi:hypothetical protein
MTFSNPVGYPLQFYGPLEIHKKRVVDAKKNQTKIIHEVHNILKNYPKFAALQEEQKEKALSQHLSEEDASKLQELEESESKLQSQLDSLYDFMTYNARLALQLFDQKNDLKKSEQHILLCCEKELREHLGFLDGMHLKSDKVRKVWQRLHPLTRKATRNLSRISINAAARGKALQAGLSAISEFNCQNFGLIPFNSKQTSKHQVYIIANGVIKKMDRKALSEEKMINELFDLLSSEGMISSFRMRKGALQRFGNTLIPQNTLLKSYTYQELYPHQKALGYILKKLTPKSKEMFEQFQKQLESQQKLNQIKRLKEKSFFYKKGGQQDSQEMSFWELKSLFFEQKLHYSDSIQIGNEGEAFLLDNNHPLQNFLFSAFLDTSSPLQDPLFIPQFKDEIEAKVYECLFNSLWNYKGKVLTFKKVILFYMEEGGSIFQETVPLNPGNAEIEKLIENMQWNLQLQNIGVMQPANNGQFLYHFDVKPYVPFLTMTLLNEDPQIREGIFNRLTPEAQYSAILTAEFQFLDLNSQNLGVVPQDNEAIESFQKTLFSIDGEGSYPFLALRDFHLREPLDGKTISYTLKGQPFQGTLQALPQLKDALETKWRLAIFDTDLSLSENNYLHKEKLGDNPLYQHLIPLRSTLLEIPWKDQPLSDAVLDLIEENDAKEEELKNWMQGLDRPIFQRLTEAGKKRILTLLEPHIKQYSLNAYREKNDQITLLDLQELFSEEITDPQYLDLWTEIQEELPFYDFSDAWVRKKIALQFFPRMTVMQQNALLERREKRRLFLQKYKKLQALESANLPLDELLKNITSLLDTPPHCFSTNERKNILRQLKEIDNLKMIKEYLTVLLNCSRPTFFNIVKAMYPLLADFYALNEEVYGEKNAGTYIGDYLEPLEKTLTRADGMEINTDLYDEYLSLYKDKAAFFGTWENK